MGDITENEIIDPEVKLILLTQASIENIDNDAENLQYTKENIDLISFILFSILLDKDHQRILIISK